MRAINHIVWKEPRKVRPAAGRMAPVMKTSGCKPCHGTGHVVLSEEAAYCPACNGRGWVWVPASPVKLEFDI